MEGPDLTESYLPHFEAAIKEGGAFSVMCAYNSIDSFPACANKMLLEEHLRRDWGFKGFVLNNAAMIIAGTVVGSAGTLLTQLMAKSINRPISGVLFSNFGGGGAAG